MPKHILIRPIQRIPYGISHAYDKVREPKLDKGSVPEFRTYNVVCSRIQSWRDFLSLQIPCFPFQALQ